MSEEEKKDIELAQKINKIIYYDFKSDIKNDIFIVLDALTRTTELKNLTATQALIKNQYYIIQNEKEKHLEKIIQKQQEEIEFQKDINKTEHKRHKQTEKSLKGIIAKKDKIIDKMAEKIFDEGIVWENKEEVIKYFEKKVEEDK